MAPLNNLFADRKIARTVVDSIPTGVGVWYLRPSSCFLNDGVRELTGYSNDDFQKGRRFWLSCINPHDRAQIYAAWKDLQSKSTIVASEYRFLPKGKQEEIWIKDVSHSFERSGGRIGGIISVYNDISKAREQRNGVSQASDQLTRIVLGLVHDLRNHVQTIGGAVELAQMTGPRSFRSDHITRAVEGINKLIGDFKEYFIPPVPQPSTARLDAILQDIARRSEEQCQHRGITLELDHYGDLPRLWLDAQQVTKALETLLAFSLSMLEKGGEVRVQTQEVADNGEELLEMRMSSRSFYPLKIDENEVFQPYPELQQSKAGLGIALARELLLRNHGRLSFQQPDPRVIVWVVSFTLR